jgi:CRISPR/Cas system CSM-associated protein Csm4 (group 5 of RAMP superfamily)
LKSGAYSTEKTKSITRRVGYITLGRLIPSLEDQVHLMEIGAYRIVETKFIP